MSLPLHKTDDPRSPLQKARRVELADFAEKQGFTEIKKDMPAELMRVLLQRRGVYAIPIPNRVLGALPQGKAIVPTQVQSGAAPRHGYEVTQPSGEINAIDLMMAEYATNGAAPAAPQTTVPDMKFLRAECKRRGLKQPRGASAAALMELLNGQVAS